MVEVVLSGEKNYTVWATTAANAAPDEWAGPRQFTLQGAAWKARKIRSPDCLDFLAVSIQKMCEMIVCSMNIHFKFYDNLRLQFKYEIIPTWNKWV